MQSVTINTKALKKYRSNENELITHKILSELPFDTVLQIYPNKPGAIQIIKISDRIDGLSFRVDMKKGEKWTKHHCNCIKVILVYKGKLKGLLDNKIAKRNDIIEFNVNKSHEIIALEDSVFYVEFINPEYIL